MRPSAREAGLGTRFGKWAGALIVAIASLGALPTAAHAQVSIGGDFNTRTSELRGWIGAPAGSVGGSWTRPVVTTYSRVLDTYCVFTGPGCTQYHFACNPSGSRDVRGLPADQPFSDPYIGRIILVSFSPLNGAPFDLFDNPAVTVYCAGPSSPGVAIPTPPTPEQIWKEASVAGSGPVVELRPTGRGLTGLPTPLWLTMSPVTADDFHLSVNGWTIDGTVRLERVEWRVADGASDSVVAAEGSVPPGADYGSQAAPLQTFQFRTKGAYVVTGTAVWSATGTISYGNVIRRTLTFPEAGLSTSYDYPVSELVGILDR